MLQDDPKQDLAALQYQLAMGQSFWIERWAGSNPQRGSSIWSVDKIGCHKDLIAHFGDLPGTHEAVTKIVQLHNAAMNALLFGSNIGQIES